MLFSKCLRAKIYCNVNVHFDPQGCQTLLLKESELFFLSLGSWTISEVLMTDLRIKIGFCDHAGVIYCGIFIAKRQYRAILDTWAWYSKLTTLLVNEKINFQKYCKQKHCHFFFFFFFFFAEKKLKGAFALQNLIFFSKKYLHT